MSVFHRKRLLSFVNGVIIIRHSLLVFVAGNFHWEEFAVFASFSHVVDEASAHFVIFFWFVLLV